MGGVLDAIGDFLSDAWDAVKDFVELVWDEIVSPILEEVFSWFGIEDETIVEVQKISSKIYETATSDMYQEAIIRTVLAMPKNDAGFFRNYMQQVYGIKGQMMGWYRDGDTGSYWGGLPEMVLSGGDIDSAAVADALNTELGGTNYVLSNDSTFPSVDQWFKYQLQSSPYFYHPWNNTLTYADPNGDQVTGWDLGNITYDAVDDNYDISISQLFDETKFWIEGPEAIREESTGTYTVKCNRTVPAGKSVQVNLAYSGTAVDGTDYTAVASVTILESTSSIDFDIVTLANTNGSPDFTVSIDSIVDTQKAFIYRTIRAGRGSITTTIKENDGKILTIPDVYVDETAGSATVTVRLEEATTGSFTVDISTSNGTAIAGSDYTFTSESRFFAGTAGEEVTISVPISTDAENDDDEYFNVGLSNCTDGTVIITQTGKVWINDDTDVDPAPGQALVTEIFTQPNWINEPHLIVTYHTSPDPASEWYYWLYKLSLGTYPGIEPTSTQISNMDMMPIAILRKDKENIVDIWKDNQTVDPTTGLTLHEHWNTTRRLLNKLSLSLQEVTDNLSANPDIGLIDDAYIHFSISPIDTSQELSKILYKQWYFIIVTKGLTSNISKYTATIEERDIQNALVWDNHGYTADNAGSVCPVGEYTHYIDETASDADGTHTRLILQHQTGVGLYDEIFLSRLNSMAAVNYGGFHKMAVNTCSSTDTNFTIPVSWFILNELTVEEIVRAYPKMLRLDMNAIQIIELEWYETEAFWDLFSFAAIIITVVTAGIGGGFLAVIQQLAINYLIIELVIWVAEATGNEILAAVIGIVAAIALGQAGAMPSLDFTSAEGLLELSTNFADNLTAAYEPALKEIGEDMQALNEAAEARMEEINKANDELGSGIDTEWLVALQSQASNQYMAISAQYDFDQIYSYDRLISRYHENKLQIGVV